MRWKAKDYTTWHPYFTWLPMKVNNEWVWMERILRKGRTQIIQNKNAKYRWEFVNSELDLIKQAEQEKQWANESVQSSPAGAAMGTNIKGR